MNLKQLSHDIYHASRGDKCRVEDIEGMLEKGLKLAEIKGYTDAEYDHGLALDSLDDKPETGLKPCPFCGAAGEIHQTHHLHFVVRCTNDVCQVQGMPEHTPLAAKTVWNERVVARDTTVKRKFCLNCAYEIGASSVICTHCGTPVPSDAEAWQHANDTVVVGDMVRIGRENEALRLEVGELRDINSAAHDQLAEAYEEQERLRQRMKGCS